MFNFKNNEPLFKLTISEFESLFNGNLSSLIEVLLEKKLNDISCIHTEDPTLDVDGASQLLKISKQSVYQNIKSIPHRKIFGRLVFLREELLEFIDNNGKVVRNKGDPG